MNSVAIKRANRNNFEQAVEEIISLIDYESSRDKVLLKPNIVVAASPEEAAVTHPKIVEALVLYFRKLNKEVVIAEGTGIFSSEKDFEFLLRSTGYHELRESLNVPIINLEQTERRKVVWRQGFIELPVLLRDHEYINIPTMKTHLQTTVSLGTKNQKGLIPMKTKKGFHKKGLHSSILDLSEVVSPDLTLVDAIYCIEGTGPTGPPVGKVKRMDLLIAGRDMMAVDNVCVRIMGFDVRDIKHLRRIEDIRIIGEEIEAVQSGFEKPMAGFQRDPFYVYMDERACTMCTVSFYQTLSKIINTPELQKELQDREDLRNIKVILGPGDPPHDLGSCAVCIGDCSTRPAKKAGIPQIRGCHPDFREIVNFFFPGFYPGL